MPDFLLSFEFDEKGDCLMIHGDPDGLQKLSDWLSRLVTHTKLEHDHLMTPQWSGHELSGQNKGGKVVHHVKTYCWKGDKPQIGG
jgi:hypothetical protein